MVINRIGFGENLVNGQGKEDNKIPAVQPRILLYALKNIP
jgi:hypothetical protein